MAPCVLLAGRFAVSADGWRKELLWAGSRPGSPTHAAASRASANGLASIRLMVGIL
jgi:hypothetical protein